jgi:hypothetical protein
MMDESHFQVHFYGTKFSIHWMALNFYECKSRSQCDVKALVYTLFGKYHHHHHLRRHDYTHRIHIALIRGS